MVAACAVVIDCAVLMLLENASVVSVDVKAVAAVAVVTFVMVVVNRVFDVVAFVVARVAVVTAGGKVVVLVFVAADAGNDVVMLAPVVTVVVVVVVVADNDDDDVVVVVVVVVTVVVEVSDVVELVVHPPSTEASDSSQLSHFRSDVLVGSSASYCPPVQLDIGVHSRSSRPGKGGLDSHSSNPHSSDV